MEWLKLKTWCEKLEVQNKTAQQRIVELEKENGFLEECNVNQKVLIEVSDKVRQDLETDLDAYKNDLALTYRSFNEAKLENKQFKQARDHADDEVGQKNCDIEELKAKLEEAAEKLKLPNDIYKAFEKGRNWRQYCRDQYRTDDDYDQDKEIAELKAKLAPLEEVEDVAGFMEKCHTFLDDLNNSHRGYSFQAGLSELLALFPETEAE